MISSEKMQQKNLSAKKKQMCSRNNILFILFEIKNVWKIQCSVSTKGLGIKIEDAHNSE